MLKRMNKFLVLLIVVCMFFSLIACSDEKKSEEADKKEETGKIETVGDNLLEKTIEISWGGKSNKITDNGPIQKLIEEKFNVKIKNVVVSFDKSKLGIMMASGEAPDIYRPGYEEPLEIFKDGMLRTIPKDFISEYAPGQIELLESHTGGLLYQREPGKKDSYVALCGVDDTVKGMYLQPWLRLDWVEKSPIKPKGELKDIDGKGKIFLTEEAFTIDELEQILEFFVKGDPDGNNVDDTCGICPTKHSGGGDLSAYAFSTIAGSFGMGLKNQYNYLVDGEIYHNHTVPMLKDFLKLMNRWYEKGIIDEEFVTDTFQRVHEKLGNGKAGYVVNQMTYADYTNPGLKPYFPANVIEKDPDAKILITPPEKGNMQAIGKYYTFTTLRLATIIDSNVSDEKLKRILQIYNYCNFDKEGYVLTRYGIEGTHFNWEGEPYESKISWIDREAAMEDGISFYNGGIYGQTYMDINYSDTVKYLSNYFQMGDGAKYASIEPYKYDFLNLTDKVEISKTYDTTLNTLYQEFTAKAITGEIDIDDEWDDYVKEWTESGGDKMLNEINKMTTVEELKKMK